MDMDMNNPRKKMKENFLNTVKCYQEAKKNAKNKKELRDLLETFEIKKKHFKERMEALNYFK